MPFSAKTLDFIFENRLHDSRQWFNEHKPEYRALVVEPFARLVSDLAPDMLEIDGQFVTDPRVGRTICRIWRDTRYTKDPSLYRTRCGSFSNETECIRRITPAFILRLTVPAFIMAAAFIMLPQAT